jgi:hypothetical protein
LRGAVLTECWRVVFHQTYLTRLAQLERVLQCYLRFSNEERMHPERNVGRIRVRTATNPPSLALEWERFFRVLCCAESRPRSKRRYIRAGTQ